MKMREEIVQTTTARRSTAAQLMDGKKYYSHIRLWDSSDNISPYV
jgi:hypothetical protein